MEHWIKPAKEFLHESSIIKFDLKIKQQTKISNSLLEKYKQHHNDDDYKLWCEATNVLTKLERDKRREITRLRVAEFKRRSGKK